MFCTGHSLKTEDCKGHHLIFTFAPCMLLHSLYLKPTHALISKHTFTFSFIETLKLVKMFCKSIIKKIYMFRSLFCDHLQGSSFVLSAFTTFRLPASSSVFLICGRMPSICMCARCICLWVVWLFTIRQPTDRYTGHTYKQTAYGHISKRQMMKQAAERW
jgi:hypothetical protein